MRRIAFGSIRLVTTIAVFCALAAEVELASVFSSIGKSETPLILVALATTSLTIWCEATRWNLVAARFGQQLSQREVLAYRLMGSFFDNVLPTGLGSDGVRIWKLHQKGATLGVSGRIIITDRLCALAVLILIIGLGVPRIIELPEALIKHALIVVFVLAAAVLAIVIAIGVIANAWPVAPSWLRQICSDLTGTLFTRPIGPKVFAWAGLAHLSRLATAFSLCCALNLPVTTLDVVSLIPACLLLAMLPISVAGWGVREAIIIQVFGLIGVASAGAFTFSILLGFSRLLVGLLGGLVWVADQARPKGNGHVLEQTMSVSPSGDHPSGPLNSSRSIFGAAPIDTADHQPQYAPLCRL
jgi:uncharacterized membrane protein YbhN (UPF0104 family)